MQNDASDLDGKTFLITGASSGIGAATALALGRAGADVALASRLEGSCHALAKDVIASGGKSLVIRMDVGIEADVRNAVATTVAHFGRMDGAFNNAGLLGTAASLHNTSSADFDAVMRTNVMGVFWGMKYQIEAMLKTGGGTIVNTASIAAHVGFENVSAYVASKHAVMGLTRTAALEYFKQGIRVNAVCPGPTATPMAEAGFGSRDNLNAVMAGSPAGRAGLPKEIAQPVLFLLSSAASYVSGHGMVVDGGYIVQ